MFNNLFTLKTSCCALVLAGSLAAGAAPQIEPALAVPRQQIPSPNGWDFFVQAGKAKKGASPYVKEDEPDREQKLLALEREHVAQNAETFRLIQEGLQHPVMRPRENELKDMAPNGMLRELARTMGNKAHVEMADGKWHEAANTGVDIVHLGVSIMNGATLIGVLTGNAIEALGRYYIEKSASHLSGEQMQILAQRLEKTEALRPTYTNVLFEEKWRGLSTTQGILQNKDWQDFRAQPPRTKAIQKAWEWDEKTVAKMQKISDEQIQKNYIQAMDAANAQACLPYAQQKEIEPPSDNFSALLFGSSGLKRQRFPLERKAAENKLLLVALALGAYHVAHGTYPSSLQNLGTQYLQKIPTDPFDSIRPLGYRRGGDSYVLYSVGPDGVDNNGTPIENKAPNGKSLPEFRRRLPLPESKGDIVAEVL